MIAWYHRLIYKHSDVGPSGQLELWNCQKTTPYGTQWVALWSGGILYEMAQKYPDGFIHDQEKDIFFDVHSNQGRLEKMKLIGKK